MFNRYDTDHDGLIDRNELRAMLKSVFDKAGIKVDSRSLDHYELFFDVNTSNAISLNEFILLLKKYDSPIDKQWYFINVIPLMS
jgi:Ca2+-binding EF-hand superfamily protein